MGIEKREGSAEGEKGKEEAIRIMREAGRSRFE